MQLLLVLVALVHTMIVTATTASVPLDFSVSPDQILQKTKAAISKATEELDKIGALRPEECTVEAVIQAMAKSEAEFSVSTTGLTFLSYSSTSKAIRDASREAEQLIDAFAIEKGMREDLYKAFKAVKLPSDVDGETTRFLEKTLKGFRKNGLDLPEEKRTIMKEKMKRLAELETKFSTNLAEFDEKILFTKEQLEGCTETFLESLERKEVDEVEYYVATSKYPDVEGVGSYAKDPESRRRIYVLFNSRAPANQPILEEAVRIRAELANMLGYETHADFIVEDRLAKSRSAVLAFEEDLRGKLRPLAESDLKALKEIKATDLGAPVDTVTLEAWDNAYYSRLLKQRDYDINNEQLKEYFEVSHVVPEMLKIYEATLGLKFTRTDSVSVWHEEAMAFEVKDSESGTVIGYFYLDLHPRDGKFTHAACFPLIPGHLRTDGSRQVPVSAILANFTKATASRPSLLQHGEVVTLFHELGHAMHSMCALTNYSRFHGTAVERDFVEAPSQMLENWCWNKGVLKRLSRHYKTGEPMPEDLIERLIKTDKFMAGLGNLRQIFFGLFDLTIHSMQSDLKLPTGDASINELYARLKEEISLIGQPAEVFPAASFGHMMGGYDAGYYGYLWSKVFSSDMFASRFEAEGLDNPVPGRDYRRAILQPGGSRDGNESLKEFLGRDPKPDAFLHSIGL